MLTAAALAVAACSPAAGTTTAPEASAAVPDLRAAEAFVRSLYGDELPGGLAEFMEERPIWSTRTRALLLEAVRLTPEGQVGFFEADAICDCQDGTPVLQSAVAAPVGPDRVDVAVVQGFAEPDNDVHRKTYNLVREGGEWRIDDQHYESMGEFPQAPMLQRLTVWIAAAKV